MQHSESTGSSDSALSPHAVAQYFATSASSSPSPTTNQTPALQCDPLNHRNCCGGSFESNSFEPCRKRVRVGDKLHTRGQVCLCIPHAKCASCTNVAHRHCIVMQSNGSFIHANSDVPWRCRVCQTQAANAASASAALTVLSGCADVKDQKQDVDKYHTFMTKGEMLRILRASNWRCRSTQQGRMYFECLLSSCDVKFSAKNHSATDDFADGDEWLLKNLPSVHSCGPKTKVASSLVCKQDVLSGPVFSDIQRLACSGCFTSHSIQTFIRATHSILVDTKLIYNIGYRAREKLFGGNGDLQQLVEQQKVACLV